MIKELTSENFNEFTNSDNLTIVKVGANWCGPCIAVKPILEKLSETYTEQIIGDVDADSQSDLAKSLNVRSIPTTIFYKNGKEIERIVGAFSEDDIKNKINKYKN